MLPTYDHNFLAIFADFRRKIGGSPKNTPMLSSNFEQKTPIFSTKIYLKSKLRSLSLELGKNWAGHATQGYLA
jgi:hypothetical protein